MGRKFIEQETGAARPRFVWNTTKEGPRLEASQLMYGLLSTYKVLVREYETIMKAIHADEIPACHSQVDTKHESICEAILSNLAHEYERALWDAYEQPARHDAFRERIENDRLEFEFAYGELLNLVSESTVQATASSREMVLRCFDAMRSEIARLNPQ